MPIEIGHIEALFRYPVKSMAGQRVDSAVLGWHGIEGDRRLALRREDDRSGFPFLTAGKLPALLLYTPEPADVDLPTHVRTPEGESLPVFSNELAADIGRRSGSPVHSRVQMMQFKHGVFDDGAVSVIASATIGEIARLCGVAVDARRFRPNILVRLRDSKPFEEDQWVGATLTFGDAADAPAIAVTVRDERCAMLNLDPDTARAQPEVMKSVVAANGNYAGVYATVIRTGRVSVGQRIVVQRG